MRYKRSQLPLGFRHPRTAALQAERRGAVRCGTAAAELRKLIFGSEREANTPHGSKPLIEAAKRAIVPVKRLRKRLPQVTVDRVVGWDPLPVNHIFVKRTSMQSCMLIPARPVPFPHDVGFFAHSGICASP